MVDASGEIQFRQPKKWDYEAVFKEYMLLLGKKRTLGLESLKNYPEEIGLNQTWHNALNEMRKKTKSDGHERYTLITYDEAAREFYFPEISAKGEPREVPAQTQIEEVDKALNERKITSIIGDIHTHPSENPFSPPDLWRAVVEPSYTQCLVTGLVTEKFNTFLFRSSETKLIVRGSQAEAKAKLKSFSDHWMKQAGFSLNEADDYVKTSPTGNMWDVNLGVAREYHLALYRGHANRNLIRMDTNNSSFHRWSELFKEVFKG